MRKSIPADLQQTTPLGGSLNRLPRNYKISQTPIGDAETRGLLAHVTEKTRNKILESGFGEMQSHLEYIKKQIGYIKKMKAKNSSLQLGLDFGE